MEYYELADGNNMPKLGYGTYLVKDSECVYNAIKTGYRLIDTAAFYDNEEFVGAGIKKALDEKLIERKDLFVTTKVWFTDFDTDNCQKSIERSLKKLGVEYIDLVLLHWPFGDVYSAWKVLCEYKEKGLIKSIGVSNMSIDRIIDLSHFNKYSPVVNQIEGHLYGQRNTERKWLNDLNIRYQAYAPLGRNWFSGILDEPELTKIAKKHNKTNRQIVLKYLIDLGFSVIPKTTSVERMKENLNIFDINLSNEEKNILASLNNESYHDGKLNDPQSAINMLTDNFR